MAAHLTKQELLELITMYNEGVRPLHIAKKINRDHSLIYYYKKKFGLKRTQLHRVATKRYSRYVKDARRLGYKKKHPNMPDFLID